MNVKSKFPLFRVYILSYFPLYTINTRTGANSLLLAAANNQGPKQGNGKELDPETNVPWKL
uniref:Uncharacterized protein n=1 Tax=Megaselia scalaris TaxID=36166 RepID=T1GYM3_MEGSC